MIASLLDVYVTQEQEMPLWIPIHTVIILQHIYFFIKCLPTNQNWNALLDLRCILLMFNFYLLHRVLHSIYRVEIPLTQDFVTFYSVAFILFILTGCFMDNVCHDPGYKFTKDCQEIQCRGGMMGFQVVKEGMRGIFLFLGTSIDLIQPCSELNVDCIWKFMFTCSSCWSSLYLERRV